MAYPSAIDSFTNPAGTSLLTSPDHAAQHTNANNAIVNIENTLGTNGGTSVLKNFALGDFAARINQETFGSPTTVGGTIKNPTIGTPAITSGTMNNGVFGTPTITLSSDATGDMFYRSAGGTMTRLGIGASGQVITTNGTTPNWATNVGSIKQILQASGTSVISTTSSAFSDISSSECQVTPTFTTGKAMISLFFGCSSSSSTNRIAGQIVINGVGTLPAYIVGGKSDTLGNAGLWSAQVYVTGIGTGLGTIKGQFASTDTGTAYVASKSLTVIEYG